MANSAALTIDCAGPVDARDQRGDSPRGGRRRARGSSCFNPQARHNLGVSVLKPIHIVYRGHVGSFTAGLCDGITAEVHGTCGWGVADT